MDAIGNIDMCNKATLHKLVDESALEPIEKMELSKVIREDDSTRSAILVLLSIRVGNYVALSDTRDSALQDAINAINKRCSEQCENYSSWKYVIIQCRRELYVLGIATIIALILRPELRDMIQSIQRYF